VNKKEMFTIIESMEEQIVLLSTQLGEFRKKLEELVEENHDLKVENEHLRKRFEEKLEELSEDIVETIDSKSSSYREGYENLARLYYEGFHICNVHYGSNRKNEECLFCLGFFNK
jgi:regulator of replication initiation timing